MNKKRYFTPSPSIVESTVWHRRLVQNKINNVTVADEDNFVNMLVEEAMVAPTKVINEANLNNKITGSRQ